MSTDPTKRQPAGIPVGGQFASHDRAEASASLPPSESLAVRNLRDLVRARDEQQVEAKAQFELANAAYVRQVLLDLHPDISGAEFVRSYQDDSFMIRSMWDDNGERIENTAETIAALSWALSNLERNAGRLLGDIDQGGTEETVTMSVRQPILGGAEQARAMVATASRDAGLGGIMPAMLDVLLDRGEPDIVETITILEEDDITELYDDVVGPAADHLEAFVRNIAKRNEISARELSYDQKIMEEGR